MRYVSEVTSLGDKIDELPQRMRSSFPDIKDELFWKLYAVSSKFSLLHITGFLNLYQSFKYVQASRITGDVVECGCFLGGASIFMFLVNRALGMPDRKLWLFDTFEGFPLGEKDQLVANGQVVPSVQFSNFQQDVRDNFQEAGVTCQNVNFVEGPVEETLSAAPIGAISVLRLDTDFYASTIAELETLYHKLVRGGVLIIDDYGMFEGARRATDTFFAELQMPPLLNRIDHSVWAGVKP